MKPVFRLGCLLAALGAGTSAPAATITVTSLADNTTVDGQVTLREAVLAANTDASVDGSAAGSGADEIVFATGPGTVVLSGAPLAIEEDLTVTGLGAGRLALDGNHASRVLEVLAGTVALSGLTIRNGRAGSGDGGGIASSGPLTVSDCVFSGNAAFANGGAISTDSDLTVIRSVFSGNSALNGGGIRSSSGTLVVSSSTFHGNFTGGIAPFVGGGGAIASVGPTLVTASTFSSNTAGNGGAIVNSADLTLTNSTVAGNSSLGNGGGIINANGLSVFVTASTITGNQADTNGDGFGNGGGIYIGGNVTFFLRTTIVAQNLAPTGPDMLGTVQFVSADNVVGVDGGFTGISHGTNGNQIGTAGSPLDPVLGPLQNNGGPTLTRAVLAGSPALDRGSAATCPTFDQRGVPRPLDGDLSGTAVCDVGAYEGFTVASSALSLYTLTPCRVVDTRGPAGDAGGPALAANTTRFLPVGGLCGIPGGARAVVVNVTVVNASELGNLRLYPMGATAPLASAVNFAANKTRANNAVVPLGTDLRIAVQLDMAPGSSGTAHVVLDVFGYLRDFGTIQSSEIR